MENTHSFENTVVAVLADGDQARDAVDRLGEAGYEVEVLVGESGIAHLDPPSDDGFWASMKKAASSVLGDEQRVLEQLDSALEEGSVVVSVDVGERDSKEAVSILREQGGEHLWKFTDWTFTPIEP